MTASFIDQPNVLNENNRRRLKRRTRRSITCGLKLSFDRFSRVDREIAGVVSGATTETEALSVLVIIVVIFERQNMLHGGNRATLGGKKVGRYCINT